MTKRLVAAALLFLPIASFAADCAPPGGEKQVAIRLQGLFDAMAVDDAKGWNQIVDPSFYAFDANRRLDGNALFELLKAAHGAGVKIVWRLDEIDVHIDCSTAWFSLMNRGSVGDTNGSQPISWQESGIFNYVQGQWKLRFFHSNRVQSNS
ncbi:MAG TPA: hypothetical protein VKP60_19525 [Magnetospirillaceae bacterium]|nr:hypothetical protein [Magnetospirillaceae bacterium]